MCLIVFAHRAVPGYELILIANRDEFLDRPTRKLQWWDGGEILAGKDLKAGGTWLGVNRSGVWTALTNYREVISIPSSARSRGFLTTDMLKDNLTLLSGDFSIPDQISQYAGFNLLYGDRQTVGFVSNRGGNPKRTLLPGIYGLSNASLDTSWPKVEQTKARFQTLIEEGRAENTALFDILGDDTVAPDDQLPDTGVGIEWEKKLSAVYINAPEKSYGTRIRTILKIREDGLISMTEWSRGEPAPSASFEFFRANARSNP